MREAVQETLAAGVRIAPAVGGAVWYSHTLTEWVAIITILYVVLQIGLLLPRYLKIFNTLKEKIKMNKFLVKVMGSRYKYVVVAGVVAVILLMVFFGDSTPFELNQ